MNQNIYTKSYQNVFSYKQANPLVVNNQYDKEKSLQRNNKRKSSDSKKSGQGVDDGLRVVGVVAEAEEVDVLRVEFHDAVHRHGGVEGLARHDM